MNANRERTSCEQNVDRNWIRDCFRHVDNFFTSSQPIISDIAGIAFKFGWMKVQQ